MTNYSNKINKGDQYSSPDPQLNSDVYDLNVKMTGLWKTTKETIKKLDKKFPTS